ncbi:hypothetical protein [Pseudomonas sp. LFM046]|uniref:hypothetical protein n=1 Tax=Pseudomonas sp. LFM046 TaxID=1608357 RepID=UPI0005CFDE18|nr:hypothetical protein [Pseudomonas sp. LFM046]
MDLQQILQRNCVPDGEEVAIALHLPSWDPVLKRGTAGAFRSYPNKSCSRLKILPIEEIVEIFKREIMGGNVKIEAYGIITVAEIKRIGLSGETPIEFEVTEAPEETNPAHAEIIAFVPGKTAIRNKLTGGASQRLCDALDVKVLA